MKEKLEFTSFYASGEFNVAASIALRKVLLSRPLGKQFGNNKVSHKRSKLGSIRFIRTAGCRDVEKGIWRILLAPYPSKPWMVNAFCVRK